jgi:hypothetical protein
LLPCTGQYYSVFFFSMLLYKRSPNAFIPSMYQVVPVRISGHQIQDQFLSLTGYKLISLEENETGLTAHLGLMGTACNAFGQDIPDVIVQVTYETDTRCLNPS